MKSLYLKNLSDLTEEEKQRKWELCLKFAFEKAKYVEFNILYDGDNLEAILKKYKSSFVSLSKAKDKIYSSGRVTRFILTEEIKNFIAKKNIVTGLIAF